jgi:radical SAM superfamily enzyme YgiQ (UPF0313 family)
VVDILIIIPSSIDKYTRHEVPPLGPLYIAATLKKYGYSVEIIDLCAQKISREEFIVLVSEKKPKIVAISSLINIHNNAIRIAKIIKNIFNDVPIIFGGAHASAIPNEVLKEEVVDIISLFESELTLVELADYYIRKTGNDLKDIKGIAYKNNGQVIFTDKRQRVSDLDTMPFPARELVDMKLYTEAGSIITGRGCIYKCKFCAANYLSEGTYRTRSIPNIIEEIRILIDEYDVKDIFILDDTFILDEGRIAEFCESIEKENFNITWSCTSRINPPPSSDILKIMKNAGCRKISFGVESGDNEVLKKVNKGTNVDQVREIIKMTHDIGIALTCFFIIGFPYDTRESIEKTIAFSKELRAIGSKEKPVYTTFSLFTPLPGTVFYNEMDKYKIKLLKDNWDYYNFNDPVIETEHLSKEMLRNYMLRTMSK